MIIVHICQRDDPDTGGSLRVAEALVRKQRSAGDEAWILFLYGPPAHVAEAFGEKVLCLQLKSSRQALPGVFRLRAAIRKIKPDIIHEHDGIVWPRLAMWGFGMPPIVMHSHLPVRPTDSRVGRSLIRSTTRLLAGISLPTIHTWVDDGFPPSRIHYIPNGVDFGRFKNVEAAEKEALLEKLRLPSGRRVLLWVGRVHRSMKGSDRVERTARLLPDQVTLVVVGNGPEYEGMIERNHDLIEAGRLVMAGSCSVPEEYYRVADGFLFTSYHEPFGLVILEAVASGLPIIAYPVLQGGGAVALLREFGASMLDDDDPPETVTQKIDQLFSLAEQVKQNLAVARRKYSWRAVAERVADVYAIALNKRL